MQSQEKLARYFPRDPMLPSQLGTGLVAPINPGKPISEHRSPGIPVRPSHKWVFRGKVGASLLLSVCQ
jgi:hypothetical protein